MKKLCVILLQNPSFLEMDDEDGYTKTKEQEEGIVLGAVEIQITGEKQRL
jgi:hypothetical protein